jgi:large subunit ribosomal protein L10
MDTTQKNNANRQKKSAVVAEVSAKIAKSKAMVFTNYTGLTHKQLEEFKREIKKVDAQYEVVKNTLLKRALSEHQIEVADPKAFDMPTGTMFAYGDIVAPLKILSKMIKDTEKPAIKFGVLDKAILSEKDVLTLSSLPSREQLLGQLVGTMKSPITGLHRALIWNIQKLVMTLKAVESKKA